MNQMCERPEKRYERRGWMSERKDFNLESIWFLIYFSERSVLNFFCTTQYLGTDGSGKAILKTTNSLIVLVSFSKNPLVKISCVLKII